MATTASVAERRAAAIGRLLDEAAAANKRLDENVKPPAAIKDVEIQRISLIEYAADVLAALNAQHVEAQAQAKAEKQAAKAEAKAAPEPAKTQAGKPDKSNDAA